MINVYKANPEESSAHFNLKNLIIPDINGDFSCLSGVFAYDPENLDKSRIEAFIDVKTVDTGSSTRDEHLKGSEFFHIQKFPKIKFISKKIEEAGDKLKVTGDLTVKNVTREATLTVKRPENTEAKSFTLKAMTVVNREKFKLELGSVLEVGEMLIGDDIEIVMDIQLEKS